MQREPYSLQRVLPVLTSQVTTLKTHFTIHHSSLLIVARSTLATRVLLTPKAHEAELTCYNELQTRCNEFYQLSKYPRLTTTQTTCYKFCFVGDVKLHLPHSRKSHSFACETLHAFGTIDGFSTTFYNKVQTSISTQTSYSILTTSFIILKHVLKQNTQLLLQIFPDLFS